METDRIKISSDGTGREAALNEVEKYANYIGLDEKQALKVRLLSEETVGMVDAITGEFNADFWIEGDNGVTFIHLLANTKMNLEKKEQLVSVSTSGKNEAAKGFMGKIKEFFENGLYNVEEVDQLSTEYGGDPIMYASMGMYSPDGANFSSLVYKWSLNRYREKLEDEEERPAKKEAWDELEKSIVANLADDVKVSVSGDSVELVIESDTH